MSDEHSCAGEATSPSPHCPQVILEPAAPVGNKASAGLTDGSDQPLFPHLVGH